jgi:hypothetical protein
MPLRDRTKCREAGVTQKISSNLSALLIIAAPLGAQWLKYPTPGIPRTAGGKPNLSAPKTADGAERLYSHSPRVHCLPDALRPEGPSNVQIPEMIIVLNEDLTYRQILLDGHDPSERRLGWQKRLDGVDGRLGINERGVQTAVRKFRNTLFHGGLFEHDFFLGEQIV